MIYIQNWIPFNKRVEQIEWISVASVFLLDFVKRWVWIACMYTLYTPRCFAISQVEANIKQSSGLMRALTRPNGHAGVNTLEATLHCNAKGVAVSGYHIYTCSTNSISVENFILSQYTYILQWICTKAHNLCHDNRQLYVIAINRNHSASKIYCN